MPLGMGVGQRVRSVWDKIRLKQRRSIQERELHLMGFTQVKRGGQSLSIDFFIRCMFIEHQLRHPGKASEQEDPASCPQGTLCPRQGR